MGGGDLRGTTRTRRGTQPALRGPMKFAVLCVCLASAGCSGSVDDVTTDDQAVTQRCDGPFNCFLPNPDPVHGENNRLRNRVTGGITFPLAPGTHLHDGTGNDRGEISSPA